MVVTVGNVRHAPQGKKLLPFLSEDLIPHKICSALFTDNFMCTRKKGLEITTVLFPSPPLIHRVQSNNGLLVPICVILKSL